MRFLVLPGYLQSGKTSAEKSSGIRKLLKKANHELEYIDPPRVLSSPSELAFKLGDTQEEIDSKWQNIVDANNNRCWWLANDTNPYLGFVESYNHMVKHITENGPYDGIIGFSQGAGMSLILLQQFNFKVCLSFSGFCFTLPSDPSYDKVNINYQIEDPEEYKSKNMLNDEYKKYYGSDTPILNIYGNNDNLVPRVRSIFIESVFKNVESYEFEGGHMMPNKKPFLAPIVERVNSIDKS